MERELPLSQESANNLGESTPDAYVLDVTLWLLGLWIYTNNSTYPENLFDP